MPTGRCRGPPRRRRPSGRCGSTARPRSRRPPVTPSGRSGSSFHLTGRPFSSRERLESDGLPVVRRWKFLLVGAANEDDARALADRIRAEAPGDVTIAVEPGGEMVWEVAPRNPFAVFGGLGG